MEQFRGLAFADSTPIVSVVTCPGSQAAHPESIHPMPLAARYHTHGKSMEDAWLARRWRMFHAQSTACP